MIDTQTQEDKMDINTAPVGAQFYTIYATMDYDKPRSNVTRWSLLSAEHRVAVLCDRITGKLIPNHTRVIEKDTQVFDTEADAWKACATKLASIAESINKEIGECMKQAEPKIEEAA